MANYLVHHTKKRKILVKKENELLKIIRASDDFEKIRKAAEEVRAAKLRVLNALQSMIIPSDVRVDEKQLTKIEKERVLWCSIEVEEIINKYKTKIT